MMQRTANENAACIRRICKRSDQPNWGMENRIKEDHNVNSKDKILNQRNFSSGTLVRSRRVQPIHFSTHSGFKSVNVALEATRVSRIIDGVAWNLIN